MMSMTQTKKTIINLIDSNVRHECDWVLECVYLLGESSLDGYGVTGYRQHRQLVNWMLNQSRRKD